MKKSFVPLTIILLGAVVMLANLPKRFGASGMQKTVFPGATDSLPGKDSAANAYRPKIQVVFALDATGSMQGLLGAAREKIWSIAGSLSQADPSPVVEMGLIFYRDRGDQFITKQTVLTADLDDVYEQLMMISADGGGDSPESVNQALHEAVNKFSWDTAVGTYRTIFLVGDCPPHMDYRDDVKYPVSCQDAKQRDIVLNTILMGNNSETSKIWKEIASCSQGSYIQVGMDANDIAITTPFDDEIAQISDRLDDSRIYYGTVAEKQKYTEKLSKGKAIAGASKSSVKAQRAEYNSSKVGKDAYYGSKELLENYRNSSIKLEEIADAELPDDLRGKTLDQKKEYLNRKVASRDSLQKKLTELSRKRQDYINKDLETRTTAEVENSFSNQVYKSIKLQTEKKKIYLRKGVKY